MRNVLKTLAVFVVLVMAATPTLAVKATKTATTASVNIVALEAAWTAGGPAYRAAVNKAADAYAQKMNARCQGFLDAKAAIAAYNVYTPPGAEAARDQLVKKQVVMLACMGKYGDGDKRAARLWM